MSETPTGMDAFRAYFEARRVLQPLLSGTQLLGLIQGACTSGVLDATRNPATVEEMASATNIEPGRLQDMCHALDAHGVLHKEGERYRLDEQWRVLASNNVSVTLQDTIADAFVKARSNANATETYWTLTSEERLALAKGVTFNPAMPVTHFMAQTWLKEMSPDLHTLCLNGARYLELGCVAAGAALTLLQIYPKVQVVGVELAEDLVAEARDQAEALGVSDRAQFVAGDARDFTDAEPFDFVFWSQFFFPSPIREDVLNVAFNALKPGGTIVASMEQDPAILKERLHSTRGREYALWRVISGGWGVPAMSGEDVIREFEAAGFVNARFTQTSFTGNVIAQRP